MYTPPKVPQSTMAETQRITKSLAHQAGQEATTQVAAMRHLTICAATGAVGKDVGANLHPTIVLNHPGRL